MRWLKLSILALTVAYVSERSASAQFYAPPAWAYGNNYPGGFGYGYSNRVIGFNISFGRGLGGFGFNNYGYNNYGYGGYGYDNYGYGSAFYPPLFQRPLFLAPPPIVVVQRPPVIVIDRRPVIQLQENQQPDPGPIPQINGDVKPANMLVIRPDKKLGIELPPPKAMPDEAELKQAEAELEAARQRLNALLRAKGK